MHRIILLVVIIAGLAVALPAPARAQTPARPLRVAIFGDSLTYGLHASEPERMYTAIFLQRLVSQTPVSRATIVYQDPVGLTDDALFRLPVVLAAQPELVILEIGNHEAFAGGEEIDKFPARYDELLGRLQDAGATVIAGTLAWLNYAPESPQYRDAMRLKAMIRQLCARRGIAVADVWTPTVNRPEFISRPGERSHFPPYDGDNLHPNDAGHAALADGFWNAYQQERARRLLREVGR